MQPQALALFFNGSLVLAAAITLTVCASRKLGHGVLSFFLALAGLLYVGCAVVGWGDRFVWQCGPPVSFGAAPLSLRFDALSLFFLALLGGVSLVVALFSPGYLEHLNARLGKTRYWIALFVFVFAMAAVLLSANAVAFIVFWELMSLSSLVLVASEYGQSKTQRAAVIYLGATRLATALLAGGFIVMHSLTGSWDFHAWNFAAPATHLAAALIFMAFCIKAGVWPAHLWLPEAHTAAPTPVSALMSAVMIKIALYGMLRILLGGGLASLPFAYVALTLGAVSAFWGVLFALEQSDLKRLLAYSSVENVGLILVGIGLALYGKSANLPLVTQLGTAAALLHCLNHAVYKALLFLGVGAIDRSAHSRQLNQLGGLAASMPGTLLCFLVGSMSICALPPCNGFLSKWLLYQSLLVNACQSSSLFGRAASMAAIGVLGIVGGLSVATFTKAIGIAFLGRARSAPAQAARECTQSMLAAQGVLAIACFGLGLALPVLWRLAQPVGELAGAVWLDVACGQGPPLSLVFVGLIGLTALTYLVVLKPASRACRRYITWECGFGELSSRTESTADSFAQPIARIFSPILHYQVAAEIEGRDRRHFPEQIKVEPRMSSLLEEHVYRPGIKLIETLSTLVARIQAGSIHLYLLYVCLTLVFLLVVGMCI